MTLREGRPRRRGWNSPRQPWIGWPEYGRATTGGRRSTTTTRIRCRPWRSRVCARPSAACTAVTCWTSAAAPAGTPRGLRGAGARVTAIDFSAGMLDEARRKLSDAAGVRFIAHDLHEPLPLDDASFDAVVSGLVLEHLGDLPGFFAEAHRVLRPAGRAVTSAMHPAMFLRGSQARFTDPESEEVVAPGSLPHLIGDFVMAGLRAGFTLRHVGEYAPGAEFAKRYPRAERYVGWPMLVVLTLEANP